MSSGDPDYAGYIRVPGEEEDYDFDKNIFYIAGISLIALLGIIVFVFIGIYQFQTAADAFQYQINYQIKQIQQLLPPNFALAENILTTMTSLSTQTLNVITDGIVFGTQAVINVMLSTGKSILDIITITKDQLLDQLNAVGNQAMIFFQNTLGPLVSAIENAGELIILSLTILTDIFTPILTFINTLFRAIQRLGTVF